MGAGRDGSVLGSPRRRRWRLRCCRRWRLALSLHLSPTMRHPFDSAVITVALPLVSLCWPSVGQAQTTQLAASDFTLTVSRPDPSSGGFAALDDAGLATY